MIKKWREGCYVFRSLQIFSWSTFFSMNMLRCWSSILSDRILASFPSSRTFWISPSSKVFDRSSPASRAVDDKTA